MQLIFLHGSGGSKESWQHQARFFEGADAVDLPGHPEGEPCTSIAGYVEWLRAYIQERAYREVVLVGHSLGGGIALLYALEHPEDLAGIVLVGSGARLRVHPAFLEGLAKAEEKPEVFLEFLKTGHERIEPELTEVLLRRAKENGPAVTLNDLRACDEFDIMDRLGEIRVPTLAICGTDDVMTPPKYSNFMVEKISGARAVVVPGGTHMAFAEKPEEVNAAIGEFLQGLQSG
jgi:pimeloyl-ACP methyl ester carboxylesterase